MAANVVAPIFWPLVVPHALILFFGGVLIGVYEVTRGLAIAALTTIKYNPNG